MTAVTLVPREYQSQHNKLVSLGLIGKPVGFFFKQSGKQRSFSNGATTLSQVTLSRMAFSEMSLVATLSINDIQHNVMLEVTFLLLC
jgi:hypothetical protein